MMSSLRLGVVCVLGVAACSAGSSVGSAGTEATCGRGTVFEDGKCVADGEVVTCGAGTHDDGNGECVVDSPGGLVCGTGTHDDGAGNCVPDSTSNTTCGAGTHDNGSGVCVPDATNSCGAGTHNNGAGVCVPDACQPGTHMDTNGHCVPDACQPGTHMDGSGHCVPDACQPGTHTDGSGHCVPDACQPGTHPDGLGHCVADDPPLRLAGFEITVQSNDGLCPFLIDGEQVAVTVIARDQNGDVLTSFDEAVAVWGMGGLELEGVFGEPLEPFVFNLTDGEVTVYPIVIGALSGAHLLVVDQATGAVSGASDFFQVHANSPVLNVIGPIGDVRADAEFELTVELVQGVCGGIQPYSGSVRLSTAGPNRVTPATVIAGGAGTDTFTVKVSGGAGLVTIVADNGEAQGEVEVALQSHVSFLGVARGWGLPAGEARVAWNAALGGLSAFTYDVYVSSDPSLVFAGSPYTSVTALDATISGLTPDVPVFVGVRARDGIPDDDDQNTVTIAVTSGEAEYVNATNNDLARDGSPGNPWKTIREALTAAASGGTKNIYVAEGSYEDDLEPVNALSVPSGVQLIGGWTPGATAGEWALPGGAYAALTNAGGYVHNPAIELAAGSRLDGFKVGTDVYTYMPQPILIDVYDAENVEIRNAILEPMNTIALLADGYAGPTSVKLWNTSFLGTTPGYPCATTGDAKVDLNWSTFLACPVALSAYGGTDVTLSQTTISYAGTCLAASGSTVRIGQSTLWSCGYDGVAVYESDLTLAGSTVLGAERSCVRSLPGGSFPSLTVKDSYLGYCEEGIYGRLVAVEIINNQIIAGSGIEVSEGLDGAAIKDNLIETRGTAIDLDLASSAGGSVVGNTVTSREGGGVVFTMGDAAGLAYTASVVGNNILRAGDSGIFVSTGVPPVNISVLANKVGWVGGDGIEVYAYPGTDINAEIANNVVEGLDGLPIPGSGIRFLAMGSATTTGGAYVHHNHVEHVEDNGVAASVIANVDSNPFIVMSYNTVLDSGTAVSGGVWGQGYAGGYTVGNIIIATANVIRGVRTGPGIRLYATGSAGSAQAIGNDIEPGEPAPGEDNSGIVLKSWALYPYGTAGVNAYQNVIRGAGSTGIEAEVFGYPSYALVNVGQNEIWGSEREAISASISSDTPSIGSIFVSGNRVRGGVSDDWNALYYPRIKVRSQVTNYGYTGALISNNIVEDQSGGLRLHMLNNGLGIANSSFTVKNNVLVSGRPTPAGAGTAHITISNGLTAGYFLNNTVIARGDDYDGYDLALSIDGNGAYGTVEVLNNILQSRTILDAGYFQPIGDTTVGPLNVIAGYNMDNSAVLEERAFFVNQPPVYLVGEVLESLPNGIRFSDDDEQVSLGDTVVVGADGELRLVVDVYPASGNAVIAVVDGPPLPLYEATRVPVMLWGYGQVVWSPDSNFRLMETGGTIDGIDDGTDLYGQDPDGSTADIGAYGGPDADEMPGSP